MATPIKRRWFQFSLRTALVFATATRRTDFAGALDLAGRTGGSAGALGAVVISSSAHGNGSHGSTGPDGAGWGDGNLDIRSPSNTTNGAMHSAFGPFIRGIST